ncbi:MAG TPA: cellulose binding domain-containing protein [Actinoplanes sp.]|nr:cellulose binding domain-containing protein [Actinoplanes sp.]
MCAVIGLLLTAAAAPASADEPIAPPPPPPQQCAATAKVEGEWGSGPSGGQVVSVVVRNISVTASQRWSVSLVLGADQKFGSGWNAAFAASGRVVTATSLAYNGVVQPGASTSFGFILAGTGRAPQLSCSFGGPTSRTVMAYESDNGKSKYLMEGETLTVSLPADYRPITVNGTLLEQTFTSGGYPTGQPLVATYRIARPAAPAELTTITDYACLHVVPPAPCALPQKQWRITVSLVLPVEAPPA